MKKYPDPKQARGTVEVKGEIAVLSVGAGDIKISFDKTNPAERIRAARIVTDLLKRGYALLIEVDRGDGTKSFTRALAFDENTCEYLIADMDPLVAQRHDEEEAQREEEQQQQPRGQEEAAAPRTKRPYKKRVDAEGTRAVAVARTAGG